MTRTTKVLWSAVIFCGVFTLLGALISLLLGAWNDDPALVLPYPQRAILSGLFAAQVGAVVGLAFGLISTSASRETMQRGSSVPGVPMASDRTKAQPQSGRLAVMERARRAKAATFGDHALCICSRCDPMEAPTSTAPIAIRTMFDARALGL